MDSRFLAQRPEGGLGATAEPLRVVLNAIEEQTQKLADITAALEEVSDAVTGPNLVMDAAIKSPGAPPSAGLIARLTRISESLAAAIQRQGAVLSALRSAGLP